MPRFAQRWSSLPFATSLVGLLLWGCGDAGPKIDRAFCSAQHVDTDPLPDLFDGLAGPEKVAIDYVQRDAYSSGIAIVTVGRDGPRFTVSGDTRWTDGVAVDADTVFEIASITKVFTSLLLADAVVRGEVKLEDPVAKFLPADVQFPSSITLRHLATHTAGLPRDAAGIDSRPFDSWYERYGLDDFHRFLNSVRPSTEPGTRYSYANLDGYLLGYVLSRRAGMSYEDLLTSRVLVPLGMTRTYIYDEPPGAQLATPYNWSTEETDYWMVPVGLEGSGRIRSTARDMARFAEAAMGLRATSLDEAFALTEAVHFLGPDAQGLPVEVGLGWGRYRSGGSVFVSHSGGSWGFVASMVLDLDKQVGTIVLTNSRHARDCLVAEFLLPIWLTAWQKVVPPDIGAIADLAGEYPLASGTASVTLDGSHVFAALPGQTSVRIYPKGNDRFFSLSLDLELKFERDGAGHVSGLRVRSSADAPFPD